MSYHPAHEGGLAAVDIQATAFRDDHTAELVTITQLSFDRCELSSSANFIRPSGPIGRSIPHPLREHPFLAFRWRTARVL